jgi:hypothetical protein
MLGHPEVALTDLPPGSIRHYNRRRSSIETKAATGRPFCSMTLDSDGPLTRRSPKEPSVEPDPGDVGDNPSAFSSPRLFMSGMAVAFGDVSQLSARLWIEQTYSSRLWPNRSLGQEMPDICMSSRAFQTAESMHIQDGSVEAAAAPRNHGLRRRPTSNEQLCCQDRNAHIAVGADLDIAEHAARRREEAIH